MSSRGTHDFGWATDLNAAVARAASEIQRTMADVTERLNASMRQFRLVNAKMPDRLARIAERESIRKYEAAIAHERLEGLLFVKALGIQARFELGLPLHDDPQYKQ